MLERRDVEVADQDGARVRAGPQLRAHAHLVEKRELMGELDVDLRVGLIAAGRDIEIMHRQRVAQAGAFADDDADVPAITLVAEAVDRGRFERQAREHGDAVITLLPVARDVAIAEAREALARKLVVRALGFLQAQHVGPRRLEELGDEVEPQPHRIDVPGRDFELHAKGRAAGRQAGTTGERARS